MQKRSHKLVLNQETLINLTSAPKFVGATNFFGTLGCPGTNNCTPTKTQDFPND